MTALEREFVCGRGHPALWSEETGHLATPGAGSAASMAVNRCCGRRSRLGPVRTDPCVPRRSLSQVTIPTLWGSIVACSYSLTYGSACLLTGPVHAALVGYGIYPIEPPCAYTCFQSLSTSMLECSSSMPVGGNVISNIPLARPCRFSPRCAVVLSGGASLQLPPSRRHLILESDRPAAESDHNDVEEQHNRSTE